MTDETRWHPSMGDPTFDTRPDARGRVPSPVTDSPPGSPGPQDALLAGALIESSVRCWWRDSQGRRCMRHASTNPHAHMIQTGPNSYTFHGMAEDGGPIG